MRCYNTFRSIWFDIQFDRAGYQRFLREQELSEHDIKYLSIHFINDFTLSHYKGSKDLAAGSAFFRHGREYLEQENRTTQGFYRPYDLPDRKYAAIYLRPDMCRTSERVLNRVFLHETRHHIQHCLKLPCCSAVNAGIENASFRARNQPWEIDAEEFAVKYSQSYTFLQMAPHRFQRSDLQWLKEQ